MKEQVLNIEIGVGVNDFKFGITRNELAKVVGKPDEIEHNEDEIEEEGKIEVWHYDEYELSVEFIEGNDWRLSTIAINNAHSLLQSLPIMGKKLSEVINIADVLNLGEYESEKLDVDDEHEITLLSVFDSGISFWFEDDLLTEIQISALEDE
jgi:hypothetical protein